MPKMLVVSWLVTMIIAAAAAAPAAASRSTTEMSRCSFAISDAPTLNSDVCESDCLPAITISVFQIDNYFTANKGIPQEDFVRRG